MKTKYTRHSYRDGRMALIEVQKKYSKPPNRKKIDEHVTEIIKEVGLKGTNVEEFFRSFATCAMLNHHPMYRYWRKK
jgi:hypothetical protein